MSLGPNTFGQPSDSYSDPYADGFPAFSIGGTRHMATGAGMRVVRLLIFETGTYNQQWRRPFVTNCEGPVLNTLQDQVNNTGAITPSMFGGVASMFLQPVSQVEKHIDIACGWNERRNRFMLEVEHTTAIGSKVRELIMGYTSHVGIGNMGQSIDHSMIFYINSIMMLRDQNVMTESGLIVRPTVINNSHLLANNHFGGISMDNSYRDQWMRPEDVYVLIDRQYMEPINPGDMVFDTRNASSASAVKSKRNNGVASQYIADVLSGWMSARKDVSVSSEYNDMHATLQKAREHAALNSETLTSRDFFLTAISGVRGEPIGNNFKFTDLSKLDPNAWNNTVITIPGQMERSQMHVAGTTADWNGADRNSVVASILSSSVPGLMMDLGLTVVGLQSTNRSIGGLPFTMFTAAKSFVDNIDLTPFMDTFKNRFESEIVRNISSDNQTDYQIHLLVDLLGESHISVAVDGGPMYDYVVPSFCDALMSPVITSSTEVTRRVAGDFDLLLSTLDQARTSGYGLGNMGGGFMNYQGF